MHYLVGDVQGCWGPLKQLLDDIDWSPSRDRLVLLGDLVNRGPQSLDVLRFASQHEGAVQCVLGNHDLHLLAVSQGVRPLHRNDTLHDVLSDPELPKWVSWIRQQPLALMVEGWLCVHAGVPPPWTVDDTLACADEVSRCLRGADWQHFLHQMYGNEPQRWSPELQGADRLRFITNALTRIRFVDAHSGALELTSKDGAGAAPPGCVPWFEAPFRQTEGRPIAFGHWSTLGLIQRPDLLALDTGCVWGACLSAVGLEEGRQALIQVRCPQAQRPGA